MTKTMAEVLAEHSIDTYQNQMHDETRWFCTNEGCAFETDNWHGVADREIAKHHEEVLSAAGFGLVADAKAEAFEEAAAIFAGRLPNGTGNGRAYNSYQVADMLRARAAAIRATS